MFAAWTKPEAVARWWGPKQFNLPVCAMDFRRGGAYRMVMRGPDGQDYPFHGTYQEIVEDERIVFTAQIMPGVEVLTTVTFADDGAGRTLLTVVQTIPSAEGPARGQFEGWNGQLEKLAEVLAR